MSTQTMSFTIQGMFCAKCAVAIERALTRLDGIVAAQVNYATEHAAVVYDPTRVSGKAMVGAVRGEGFDVPLERVELCVNDLLYATCAQTVERVLSRLDGVARVEVDLSTQRIGLDAFSKNVNHRDYAHALAVLGLSVAEQPSPHAAREFGLRTIIVTGLALLSLFSAGAHAGLFDAGFIHAPLVVTTISVIVVYGIAWRFYHRAYDACLLGEFDYSVLIALVASAGLFGGLLLALMGSATWFTGIGFVLTALLTAGWYAARGASVWFLPRLNRAAMQQPLMTQSQLGVTARGSRD